MNDDTGVDTSPKFIVRPLEADETDLLGQVVALGDLHKRWLGLMPRTAFAEYADRRRILIAVDRNRSVLGYALFDLPKQRVRLAHLCVSAAARHRGVARSLITELSRLHSDRQGIVLRCRRDWPANAYWPALGFTVLANRPGRSGKALPLTTWWRDHGLPDLFSTESADNPRLLVAMDTNVLRDLHEPGRGTDAEQSQALLAEWLEDDIELVLTARSKIELNQHPEHRVREPLLAIANSRYRTLLGRPQPGQPDAADLVERQLLEAIGQKALDRDPSLRNDARILAEADAGDADAFVSRDDNAVKLLAAAAEPLTDLWISTPTDLIVHLDELRDAANYSPARLLNSGYSTAEAEPRTEGELRPLLNSSTGEKLSEFRSLVRASTQHIGDSGSRLLLRAPDDTVAAAAFSHLTGSSTLTVSLLRVASSRNAKTIAIQVLHVIRKRACELNARQIAVTDPRPNGVAVAAMLETGYESTAAGYQAPLVQGRMPWGEVIARLPAVAENRQSVSDLSSTEAAELERVLWPLKVTDAPLPCFMVSIRPEPAAALLNREQLLWDNAELGLSRQHVYYRTPGRSGLEAPARILWYVSGKVGAAVATSRLEEIVIAHPGTLHRKYRRLGVLDRTVISKVARNGRAMALLFADTEFFDTPVVLDRLREIDCQLKPLASPRRIASPNFFKVYEEGHTP